MNLSCYKTLSLCVCLSSPQLVLLLFPLMLCFPLIFPLLPLPPFLSLSCLLSPHPPPSPSPRTHYSQPLGVAGRTPPALPSLLPRTDLNEALELMSKDGCSVPFCRAMRLLGAVPQRLLSSVLRGEGWGLVTSPGSVPEQSPGARAAPALL